jgi:transcription antitermination factor NusG
MARLRRKWYAVYTKSRHEKNVMNSLDELSIKGYLPIKKELREWSDRKKWVDSPLFKGYVFVKILKRDFNRVRNIPGVVGFVKFEGRPAIIEDREIQHIERVLKGKAPVSVIDEYLEPGQPVKVVFGPFTGFEGELVEFKGKKVVAVRVQQLMQSLIVEVESDRIRQIRTPRNV